MHLPHVTKTLAVVFGIMRETFSDFDRRHPPKQTSIAEEKSTEGWDGRLRVTGSHRGVPRTLAAAIRPEDLASQNRASDEVSRSSRRYPRLKIPADLPDGTFRAMTEGISHRSAVQKRTSLSRERGSFDINPAEVLR